VTAPGAATVAELCPAEKHDVAAVRTERSGRRRCQECRAEYKRQVVIETGAGRKGFARWAR
jgi:hypothetical protein